MLRGDFHGEPTLALASEHLRVEVLAEAGPRLVRLQLAESDENLLGEVPDIDWETPWGRYRLRGGHRLWIAPETPPLTSAPDDGGLVVSETPRGLRLEGRVGPSGLQKAIEIELSTDTAALTLLHELRNEGETTVVQAPWAITILPLGGVAVLPQQRGPLDGGDYLPNRSLVFWPYGSVSDPRLELDDQLVLVRGEALTPPCKIGYLNRAGWAGYLRGGNFICKRFDPQPGADHADMGSNVEVYCDDRLLELETLGPLATLEPGGRVTLEERWQIYRLEDTTPTRKRVEEVVRELGLDS